MASIDWIISIAKDIEEMIEAAGVVQDAYIPRLYAPLSVVCRTTAIWPRIPKWIPMTFTDEVRGVEDVGTLLHHNYSQPVVLQSLYMCWTQSPDGSFEL